MPKNPPDTLIKHLTKGAPRFAGQVKEYCQKYRAGFSEELAEQAANLLLRWHWILFVCGSFIITINSFKAGPHSLWLIWLVGAMAFGPLFIKRWWPGSWLYPYYFDAIVAGYAMISAATSILVLQNGYDLSNGPIQTLLIFSGWFAYNRHFSYLAARNFVYGILLVTPVVFYSFDLARDSILQGIAGYVGGTLLCYVNFRNQQLRYYALSVKERWNDYLSDQLSEAEVINERHVQKINEQSVRLSSQLDRLTKIEILEMMAQSVQMLAHDVRKPFSVVRFGVRLLNEEKDPTERQRLIQRLSVALDISAKHVDGMLNDLLAVGSLDNLRRDHVSPLQMFVEAIVQCADFSIDSIPIEYDCRHENLALVDEVKIQRVFTNLVSNALSASNKVSLIRLKTRESSGWIRVGIYNSGSFIPIERREELFNVFTCLNKPNGYGLGLAICRQMVQLHRGDIYCESGEDSGTTFWFTIPASEVADRQLERIPPNSTDQISGWFKVDAG